MINKKIIFGFFVISFFGACASPTAMLGPAYTLSSSGSIYQAGLSYGSNELITMYTGKTPMENLEEITSENLKISKNIQKQTLESEDFHQLVINKIMKTKGKIKLVNQ
tara:strand:+ start:4148 stop:4471 length:324 start_codon:yes stop_codon:yes gene_type:complete